MDLNDDRIDDYVLGRMDSQEAEDFRKAAAGDETLRADLNLTREIASALGRRYEKKARMQEWEKDIARHRKLKLVWTSVSCAACLALCLTVGWQFSSYGLRDNEFTSVRGGDAVLDALWEAGDYALALAAIDEECAEMEEELQKLKAIEAPGSAQSYRIRYLEFRMYEMEWARIQTLIRLRRYDQALERTEIFARTEGEYQHKAVRLLKKLRLRCLQLKNI